jgi:hypothetical protein
VGHTRIHPAKAALAAVGAGLLIGSVRYLLDPEPLVFATLAPAVAVLLFVMLAFPDVANRRITWRGLGRQTSPWGLWQSVVRIAIPGVVFLGVAVWVRDSLLFLVVGVYFAFWSTLTYVRHRRTRG